MIFRKRGKQIRWAEEVIDLTWQGRAARLVQAAHGVGLFARLGKGPATAADAARDLGLDAAMVGRVLIALAALDLAAREGDAWRLTPKAEATLLPEAPCYQGHTLAHSGQVWPFWSDLESALAGRQGGWVFSEAGSPRLRSHRDFILAMHNMAMAGRAAELADRVHLEGRRTLMDVGGGPGTYAMALCERNPGLRATVLDLPETIAIAREVIARLGMAGRVAVLEGDWDTSDFGSGNDVVLMSNILHGPTSGAEMKLEKARRSLVDGGVLVVQDFLMNEDETGPLIPALFNVMVGAFSVTALTGRVAAAGFREIGIDPMPEKVGTTIVTAVK